MRTASAIDVLRMGSDQVLHETTETSVARGYAPSESGRIEINRGGKGSLRKGSVRVTARHSVWCLARFGVRNPQGEGEEKERKVTEKGSSRAHRENQKRGKLS